MTAVSWREPLRVYPPLILSCLDIEKPFTRARRVVTKSLVMVLPKEIGDAAQEADAARVTAWLDSGGDIGGC